MNIRKCIVITGSTKGIGYALANAFLELDQNVIISGRNRETLLQVLNELEIKFPNQVFGICCDIANPSEIEKLYSFAEEKFHQVDVWINNAGTCTAAKSIKDISCNEIITTIETNIIGTALSSHIALKRMYAQNSGQIYNLEGWGSRGEWSAGMSIYGTTKYSISYLSKALYKETKSTPIIIGTLNPGMVATDLLISSWKNGDIENWNRMKWLFSFIIDPPALASKYLAKKILANKKSNVRFVWMTPLRLLFRFFNPHYWKRDILNGTALKNLK
jgi:short-subunit dehydrogenase